MAKSYRWHTSSYSASHQECVEVGTNAVDTGVRDTKNRDGGQLAITKTAWAAFLAAVKAGPSDV